MIYSKVIGEGNPFLIIHGFLGMSDNWKTFANQLTTQGFEVHLLDMRNHGRSFHSSEFSYEIMANDVKEYCDAHDLNNSIILGHSMGGKVAMVFAAKYPELVSGLISVDISPRNYPPHHQDIMKALNAVDFKEGMQRQDVQDVISSHIKQLGVVQFLMKNVYRKTPTQLAYRFNLEVFNSDNTKIGEAFPDDIKFKKNTLFIKGGNSQYILKNDELLIYKYFPKAQLKTIPNAGHWVHADNPQQLIKDVLKFVSNLP